MTTTQRLLSVEVVTDDDTGIYQIGELDYRVQRDMVVYIEKKRGEIAAFLRDLASRCEGALPPFQILAKHQDEGQ